MAVQNTRRQNKSQMMQAVMNQYKAQMMEKAQQVAAQMRRQAVPTKTVSFGAPAMTLDISQLSAPMRRVRVVKPVVQRKVTIVRKAPVAPRTLPMNQRAVESKVAHQRAAEMSPAAPTRQMRVIRSNTWATPTYTKPAHVRTIPQAGSKTQQVSTGCNTIMTGVSQFVERVIEFIPRKVAADYYPPSTIPCPGTSVMVCQTEITNSNVGAGSVVCPMTLQHLNCGSQRKLTIVKTTSVEIMPVSEDKVDAAFEAVVAEPAKSVSIKANVERVTIDRRSTMRRSTKTADVWNRMDNYIDWLHNVGNNYDVALTKKN